MKQKSISQGELLAHGRQLELRSEGEIILFGCGNISDILIDSLCANKYKIMAIVDNDSRKWGRVIGDLLVCKPMEIDQSTIDRCTILIAVTDLQDALRQLHTLSNKFQWISVPDYVNAVSLNSIDFAKYAIVQDVSNEFLEYVWSTCVSYQDAMLNSGKPPLRSLEVIVTERCTLKCKDCSNLMQYYSKPSSAESSSIINDLERCLDSLAWINEVRVLGGEPFINKDLDNLYDYLNKSEKVQHVVTYTNGTIVPSGKVLAALSHPKNLVLVTDYGSLSIRKNELASALAEYKIKKRIEPAYGWTDCGTVVDLNRSPEDLKDTFSECCAKNLITLSNGSLYRCPYSAHLERLEFKDFPEDRLDLTQLESNTSDKVIGDFLFEKEYISACSFCKGRRLSDPKIIPGLQTKQIMELPS